MRVILFPTDLALTHPTQSSATEDFSTTTRPGVLRRGTLKLLTAGAELASASMLDARKPDWEDVRVAGSRRNRNADTEILSTVGPGLASTSPHDSNNRLMRKARRERACRGRNGGELAHGRAHNNTERWPNRAGATRLNITVRVLSQVEVPYSCSEM